jgi:integrase
VRAYSAAVGFEISAHALRATALTNALDHQADIATVQEWLGDADVATTRVYGERGRRTARRSRQAATRLLYRLDWQYGGQDGLGKRPLCAVLQAWDWPARLH